MEPWERRQLRLGLCGQDPRQHLCRSSATKRCLHNEHLSFVAGTSFGIDLLLLERLSVDCGKKSKIEFAVYPSPQIVTVEREAYNSVPCAEAPLSAPVPHTIDNI